jgi:hypothetical protein
MTPAGRTVVFYRVMHNLQAQNKCAFCKMFFYHAPKYCRVINVVMLLQKIVGEVVTLEQKIGG